MAAARRRASSSPTSMGTQLGEVVGPASARAPGPGRAVGRGDRRHRARRARVVRDDACACRRCSASASPASAREPERQALWQALVGRELAEEVVVHPDFSIALDDAFGDGAGHPAHQRHRLGGVRPRSVGRLRALRRLGPDVRRRGERRLDRSPRAERGDGAADGREPETALIGAVLTAAQVNEPRELIAWAAHGDAGAARDARPGGEQRRRRGRPARERAHQPRGRGAGAARPRAGAPAVRRRARRDAGGVHAAGCSRAARTLRKRLEHRLKSAVPGAQVQSARRRRRARCGARARCASSGTDGGLGAPALAARGSVARGACDPRHPATPLTAERALAAAAAHRRHAAAARRPARRRPACPRRGCSNVPFPPRHHHRRQAVADEVDRRARHVHERVHAEDDGDALQRQAELRQRARRGSPATRAAPRRRPLLVSISVSIISDLLATIGMSIPAACATNTDASAR